MSDEDTTGCSGCGLGLDPHGPNCPAGSDQFGDFSGLMSLAPGPKLADHKQGPLTLELLDEMLADLPRREAAQQEAHMEFVLNQNRWQHLILGEMGRTGGKSARLQRMIRDMKFGVPCPAGESYPYVVMDEVKLPRFTKLRRHLFRNTIK